jgi:hypothetical protein
MTIHGRRMPSRDEVRSLILPKNGLPNMATRAPIPATSAKLLGACLIPTSELTLSGKVTSNGVRKTRLVLMNANVYTDMKPHPTDPVRRGRLRGQRSRHRFDDAIQLATWARELKPSLFRMLPT